MKKPREKELGTYRLGARWVRVIVNPNDGGGCFWTWPSDKELPKIEIGLSQSTFAGAVEVALHEALEFMFHDQHCRFEPTGNLTLAADNYVFMCTHPQFSEIVSRASLFLVSIYPDLKRAWTKANRR